MFRILVSDKLSDQGLQVLKSAGGFEVDYQPGLKEDALVAAVAEADALLVRSGSQVTAKVIEAGKKLRVIGRAGIGVDNVDVAAASRKGVVVMNTPTGNAVTTAEHTIALLMSIARMIPDASQALKNGDWKKKNGRELAGKTLGVIGLGNIGRIVADRAIGLRMKVIAHDPVTSAERAAAMGVELVSLEQIWQRADAITVHTPLTNATRGLINDEVIPRLKKGVLLVNCARGGIYDEAALARGLDSGHIGGVALDVFVQEPPPKDLAVVHHERAVVTPHLGASTDEAQERVAIEICHQVIAYLKTGSVVNAVNMPSVSGDVAEKLAPYAELARGLGKFLAQVSSDLTPAQLDVECIGEPGELSSRAIASTATAGFLESYLRAVVNQVSAPHLAGDRGIEVHETRSTRQKNANAIVLRIRSREGKTHEIEGSLSQDKSPRLTRWNDVNVELRLGGNALLLQNGDRPGVVGAVGTLLGQAGININAVNLGLSTRGTAVSVWTLDHDPGAETMTALRKLPNVVEAQLIQI
jgi:D-3-phosphoglycerate dehydrogenase